MTKIGTPTRVYGRTAPEPYAVVHFGEGTESGYVRFIREERNILLLQVFEPDGGAEIRVNAEQKAALLAALTA